MRRIINFALVLIVAGAIASCFGDDNETEFKVYTDAYVMKKKVNDEHVYARAFYAYGNLMMQAATAAEMGGSGEKINLSQDPGSLYTFSKIPQGSDFSPYPPATSDYQFQVISESGIIDESTDFLSHDDIEIPEITAVEFSENDKYLNVAWTEVVDADGYLIRILDTEGSEIMNSYGFDTDILEYTINIVFENWIKTPEQGETYAVQVHAYAYEPQYESGYEAYNVQEVSIAETEIIWP